MQKLEQELKLIQELEFEYLYLKDVNLQPCGGCLNCFFRGEHTCPVRNDDRDLIFNKMQQADGIIFMAPTYALHVPALMKNFFDRFSYVFHRPCFFGKVAIGVSNQGITGAKKVTSYFSQVANSWGLNFVDKLELHTIPYGGAENKMVKKIRRTCKKFVKILNGQRYQKPSLGDVLAFRVRRLLHSIARDDTNADYNYWHEQGWLENDKKYYYDVRVGMSKRIIAGVLNKILRPKFEHMFEGDPKQIYSKYLELESLKF